MHTRSSFASITFALAATALAGCPDDSINCGEGNLFVYDERIMGCACGPGLTELEGGFCLLPDGGVVVPPGRDAAAPMPDAGLDTNPSFDATPDAPTSDAPCAETVFFLDDDGDGHGNPDVSMSACERPERYVDNNDDCDDGCTDCHPGGTESCSTSTDEDCDGNPVTGCVCDGTLGTLANCSSCGDTCAWHCAGADLGCDDIERVEVGPTSNSSCALTQRGRVYCWGNNPEGQVGNGDPSSTRVVSPARVGDFEGARSVSVGASHACAVADGSVHCWGSNSEGQLGVPGVESHFEPVLVPGITNARSVTVGYQFTCALLMDGHIQCWGWNVYGTLGDGTYASSRSPVTVMDISTATAIDAGSFHVCAVLEDRTTACWGRNSFGELGAGPTPARSNRPVATIDLENVLSIDVGDSHTCALGVDSGVRCWGSDGSLQLGDEAHVNLSEAPSVPVLTGAICASAGYAHSCGVQSDGSAWCWGLNSNGRLGTGTTDSSAVPAMVNLISGARWIGASKFHTCVVLADRSARCFGINENGELGNGSTMPRTVPTAVLSPLD